MKITGNSPHLFSLHLVKVASSWRHCLRHCLRIKAAWEELGPAHYRYCSQAVGHSPSCMCQDKRRPLWAQAALTPCTWNFG